jgi:hypothetical protein
MKQYEQALLFEMKVRPLDAIVEICGTYGIHKR